MSSSPLLPLDEAIRAILDVVPAPTVSTVPLDRALGLVLAEDIHSDVDMPPFMKSMMDGYAVRAADLEDRPTGLPVAMTIHAGAMPEGQLPAGAVAKIMTGAPLPEGADAVVMVEKAVALEDGRVRLDDAPAPGQHVGERGEDVEIGDRVLSAGREIRAGEIGVLAAVGRALVPVYRPPGVAVLTTGDELVPPGETPGPGKIRNSNSVALAARVRRDGAAVEDRGVVPDDLEATRAAARGVIGRFDVVVFTGGVSMGDRDLVGRALAEEGFEPVFHKIRLKPGKPVLFGTAGKSLVFGLPGNPVSVAATYELLVRPVLRRLLGLVPIHRPRAKATVLAPAPRAIPREQYLPAVLSRDGDGLAVRLVRWHGSADLFGFALANALLVVPAGGPAPPEGGRAEVVLLDRSVTLGGEFE